MASTSAGHVRPSHRRSRIWPRQARPVSVAEESLSGVRRRGGVVLRHRHQVEDPVADEHSWQGSVSAVGSGVGDLDHPTGVHCDHWAVEVLEQA